MHCPHCGAGLDGLVWEAETRGYLEALEDVLRSIQAGDDRRDRAQRVRRAISDVERAAYAAWCGGQRCEDWRQVVIALDLLRDLLGVD